MTALVLEKEQLLTVTDHLRWRNKRKRLCAPLASFHMRTKDILLYSSALVPSEVPGAAGLTTPPDVISTTTNWCSMQPSTGSVILPASSFQCFSYIFNSRGTTSPHAPLLKRLIPPSSPCISRCVSELRHQCLSG